MDITALTDLVSENKSTRQIAGLLNTSQTNVRYWLRKCGLKTDYKRAPVCGKCGERDPDKFYGNKVKVCGPCHNKDVAAKGRFKRAKVVKYLGGCCSACGYDKYECSLDTHHIDSSTKDPNFSSMRGWSWERIRKELDHCVLLCRNCHQALHCGHDIEMRGVAQLAERLAWDQEDGSSNLSTPIRSLLAPTILLVAQRSRASRC